jgi:hypothetical protein
MSHVSQAARESSGTQRGQPDDDAGLIAESCRVPERFGAVFDRHAASIHGYIARRLGRDAADDLVAEVFLVAFRQRGGRGARGGTGSVGLLAGEDAGSHLRGLDHGRRDQGR